MSFEEFCAYVFDRLGFQPARFFPHTRLVEDLEMDSVQMYELVFILDELGTPLLEPMLESTKTLDDVYYHYVTRAPSRD